MLVCAKREDPFADSVIKRDAAEIKRRRHEAKPWRTREDFATEPDRASRIPRGGCVALAVRPDLFRLSSPVTAG